MMMLFRSMVGIILVASFGAGTPALADGVRPNIVFILIDDLGFGDLACYGNDQASTPNIDRLADEGLRFTQFYAAAPICSASRVGAITGQFPARHRITSFLSARAENRKRGMPDYLDPSAPTIARTLRKAGYAAGHFGKWHLGGGRDVYDAPLPAEYGFDESLTSFEGLGDRVLIPGHNLSEQSAALGKGEIQWSPKSDKSRVFVDRTIDFIERHRAGPFYVQLWFGDVHDPFAPRSEQLKKWEHVSPNKFVQQFYAVLDELDRQIGRVTRHIDEMGLAENTLVILTSDNGPTAWPSYERTGEDAPGSTGGLRGRKWSLYEGGIREPFIVRWKGTVPAGLTNESTIVSAVDLFPTICRLANAELPDANLDGEDMSRALEGAKITRDKPLFWSYGQHASDLQPARPIDRSPGLAIRDGRWKLLMNVDGSRTELYDLAESPREYRNIAGKHPELTAQLSAQLREWKQTLPPMPSENPNAPGAEPSVASFRQGDSMKKAAPDVVNSSLLVSATVITAGNDGVIVAHGGAASGYSLYVKNGRPHFTVRTRNQPITVAADTAMTPNEEHQLETQLAESGEMTLLIDGKQAAAVEHSALLSIQPIDPLDVGFDSGGNVGEYEDDFRFDGTIRDVRVSVHKLPPQQARGHLVTRWAGDLDPSRPLPEYPRPQLVRDQWQNLNGYWQYAITERQSPQPDSWDGRILVPFVPESLLSGVMRRLGEDKKLWYRRTFEIPGDWRGGRLLLHFGAVDWETTVWVNGKELGTHQGGYDPFSFDISDALQSEREQEIIVAVWDPTNRGPQPRGKQVESPSGIWYTPVTGIWQTVWLEPVPEQYIESLHIVPNVDERSVAITVNANGPRETEALVHWTGVHRPGAGPAGTIVRHHPGRTGEPIVIKLGDDAQLWSPDEPWLHSISVSLETMDEFLGNAVHREPTDRVQSYFGLRKIEVRKDENGIDRLYLNNRLLFHFGPLDQGWWPDGLYTAPTDEALKFDIELTKQIGFNMARKHVKVEPARWYYWADTLGLLVWQDMPNGMEGDGRGENHVGRDQPDLELPDDARSIFRRELKAMIDALRNHPSIVVWVPFNEGWGQHDTNEILRWTKEYDPTRLVDGPSGWTDRGYGDMKDLHRYPGPDMLPTEAGRASVLGEYGGLGLPVRGHLWETRNNWGYRSYDSAEALATAYEGITEQLHSLIDRGLAAAVYTQTTDVEIEVNGLITYDRAILKIDADRLRDLNQQIIRSSDSTSFADDTPE